MTTTDVEFLQAFRLCRLASLSHEDHVRLAWIVLQDQPLRLAIETLCEGFQAFAAAKNKTDMFHETVTWAFTVLIHERIQRGWRAATWEEFLADNQDLRRGMAVLEDYYEPATLKSDLARRIFLLPDRAVRNQAATV